MLVGGGFGMAGGGDLAVSFGLLFLEALSLCILGSILQVVPLELGDDLFLFVLSGSDQDGLNLDQNLVDCNHGGLGQSAGEVEHHKQGHGSLVGLVDGLVTLACLDIGEVHVHHESQVLHIWFLGINGELLVDGEKVLLLAQQGGLVHGFFPSVYSLYIKGNGHLLVNDVLQENLLLLLVGRWIKWVFELVQLDYLVRFFHLIFDGLLELLAGLDLLEALLVLFDALSELWQLLPDLLNRQEEVEVGWHHVVVVKPSLHLFVILDELAKGLHLG